MTRWFGRRGRIRSRTSAVTRLRAWTRRAARTRRTRRTRLGLRVRSPWQRLRLGRLLTVGSIHLSPVNKSLMSLQSLQHRGCPLHFAIERSIHIVRRLQIRGSIDDIQLNVRRTVVQPVDKLRPVCNILQAVSRVIGFNKCVSIRTGKNGQNRRQRARSCCPRSASWKCRLCSLRKPSWLRCNRMIAVQDGCIPSRRGACRYERWQVE